MSTGLPAKSKLMMQRHKGFSLLEILMAFAIMAVAITIVLRIFSSGVTNSAITEEYCLAVQIAEALMAETGVEAPLQIGETTGTVGDKYDWSVLVNQVTQSDPGNSNTAGAGNNQPQLNLFAIKVTVAWGDEVSEPRTVELESHKLF